MSTTSNDILNTAGGVFITIEGGEGAGKSTLARRLGEDISHRASDVILTREPGWGHLGKVVRALVLDGEPEGHLHPRVEALLFAADRAHHVASLIRPALAEGAVVICDRFRDSSVAYQGYARGLGAADIAYLSDWGSDALIPDLTVLLDLDPATGVARKFGQGEINRMDLEDADFHLAVRAGFHDIAAKDPDRFLIVDATQAIDDYYPAVLARVQELLAGA